MVFGHRGCRAYCPENSIVGFQHALELGADGIELDVVVNKDNQLVISHEPFFKSKHCLDPNGALIKGEKDHNIFRMGQEEIMTYDSGGKGNASFPEQDTFFVYKPLLQDLFKQVDLSSSVILFEVKSKQSDYNIFQPEPKEFARLIFNELDSFAYKNNIIFMSFDSKILEALRIENQMRSKDHPEYKMIYLTYLPFKGAVTFLKDLSFTPYALGMYYPTVSRRKSRQLKRRNVKMFCWTVNDVDKAIKLRDKGVDGIITDYPDKVKESLERVF